MQRNPPVHALRPKTGSILFEMVLTSI
jgi:hypothetical protein